MAKSWRFHIQNVSFSNFNAMWHKESNIHAPVLFNLLFSLRKRDKMLGKPQLRIFISFEISSTRL